MRKILPLLLATIILGLHSCNFSSYGKKVKINDSLEVYVKGDGVTEADAKKMGNFLSDLWKEYTNMKSLQLMKDNGTYVVKMVVDEKMVKEDPGLDKSFIAVKTLLESEVFSGSPVRFTITDNTFNDIRSF